MIGAGDELCFISGVELAARIRSGDISALEAVDAALARADAVNPAVNGFLARCDDVARDAARKADALLAREGPESLPPLAGLGVSLKDLTPTAGIVTTFGIAEHRDHVPEADAPIAARMRQAGASFIGKANTPAFGWLGVTDNEIVGRTNNPWDLGRSVGGSSGGSAALLAAGIGPLSTGSDGGGSIRVPAALCGIVGHKPSHGRIPRGTEALAFDTVDALGPMARTVADAALLLSVLAGPMENEPYMLPEEGVDYVADLRAGEVRGLRIAYSPDLGHGPVDPEVAAIVAGAVTHFERALSARCDTVEIDIPEPMEYFAEYYAPSIEGYIAAEPGIVRHMERYPGVATVFAPHRETEAGAWWVKTMAAREKAFRAISAIFGDHDLLVTPTMPVAAWPHDAEYGPRTIAGQPVAFPAIDFYRFTEPFGHSGHPAISINCGFTASGLPVGLQIVGRQRDDRGVLRAAAAYEGTTEWHRRRPPVAAS